MTSISDPALRDALILKLIEDAKQKLEQADRDGDGVIRDGRWKPELGADADELAKAIYDFVDYGNYSARYSLLGPATRGDVMEGGFGVGFTLRPKHHTASRCVTRAEIDSGVTDLRRRLREGPASDLPTQDLATIMERARQAGLLPAGGKEANAAIAESVEKILNHIGTQSEAKERRLNKEVVLLTNDELLESLRPAAGESPRLEYLIAETLLTKSAPGEKEHWNLFFAAGLSVIEQRRMALELGPRDESGKVGDTLQHYLLVLGKRAKETELLDRVQEILDARVAKT